MILASGIDTTQPGRLPKGRTASPSGSTTRNMRSNCRECGQKIASGEEVFQFAFGWCSAGFETPTGLDSISEWHQDCFPAIDDLNFQIEPYQCLVCERMIANNAEVAYITCGTKADSSYQR